MFGGVLPIKFYTIDIDKILKRESTFKTRLEIRRSNYLMISVKIEI